MYTLQISWKKILEILVAVLTAIIGTLSVQSCIG
ncbi:MAG: smalltalk protein [Bacteroidaceae bacterium]|nr:smalltalk protein [Bacteroidaceae bacterium]